jgi:hypothetical protein
MQGIGLLLPGNHLSVSPAINVVLGRAERTLGSEQHGPAWKLFGTASLGITLHRARGGR